MMGRKGFKVVPAWAKILATFGFTAIVAFFFWFFDEHKTFGFGTSMGLIVGAIAAALILLAGYVYADAMRRGMPPILWTALALLVPNGIGFVLYFLLRKPIIHPCSGCGHGVMPDAAFCPRCGQSQVDTRVQDPCKESLGDST